MITIHGIFGSPFVRAIRIALDEKHVPWAWAPFPLGAQKQEPYLSLQPFGKIPAIVDDGFELYETNAVLRHIDRKTPDPALIPTDPHRAARMDQLMCIVDCTLWPSACRPINFNRLVAPRIGVPVDEAAVVAALPMAETALKAIAALHNGGRFMTGDTLTLADIALLPHIDALVKTPEGHDMLPTYPKLGAWLDTMRARPSVPASNLPPEKVLAAA
jgi:glutathione S-transferase